MSKQIFYFVRKMKKRNQLFILLLLYLVGGLLGIKGIFNNYFWFKQAWVFTLFLFIGEQYKNAREKRNLIIAMAAIYCVVAAYLIYIDHNIPSLASHFPKHNNDIALNLLLALSGSFMVMGVGRILHRSNVLAYIGRWSLVIYGLHWGFLQMFMGIFVGSITDSNEKYAIVYVISSFCVVVSLCLLCAELLGSRYLKWLVGKW